jgi:hypothetical protein
MKLILQFLGGSLGPYIALAILGLIVSGFASCSVVKMDLHVKEHDLTNAKADLQKAVDANATNQKTVASLEAELEVWKTQAEKNKQADDDLVKQAKAHEQALTDKDLKLAAKQEAIDHALPNCQKLLSMDLAAVCPGHAAVDRLRSAAGGLQGPRGKGANPGSAKH